jgi:hypothetical protein
MSETLGILKQKESLKSPPFAFEASGRELLKHSFTCWSCHGSQFTPCPLTNFGIPEAERKLKEPPFAFEASGRELFKHSFTCWACHGSDCTPWPLINYHLKRA